MIEAVVFDLDGVLIDSEPAWEQVRRSLVAEYGGRWPPEAQSRLMGMSTREWAQYLVELGVGLPPEQVADLVIDRMVEHYAQELPLLRGALGAVRRLAGRWPLGLASSSPRRLIDAVLARSGLAALFSSTVSTEEVARGKPAPDVYLAVTERLGVHPAACVAVEDSTNGLRSALAAGLIAMAVPQPAYPVDGTVLQQAARVLPSLDELTADLVESLAREGRPEGP
ncbi:MAG TPA: HAD family phosphatase [Acidimicrobiales bacterium]|nr:HAD family phosphatase [Acidimicrobiales bacterium]